MTDLFETQLFKSFLQEKQFLKNVTLRIVQGYKDAFKAFHRYSKADISAQGVKDFMIEMVKSGMRPGSANAFARSINSYLTWLFENGHLSPHLKVPLQTVEKRVLRTYTTADIKKIVSYKPQTFGEKRLMTILCLMIDTGVRIDEALTLKRNGIDLDNLLVTVYGKERKIPISREARKMFFNWLKNPTLQSLHTDLAFPSRNGDKLFYDNTRRDFVNLLDKVGVEKSEGAFHTFRRFFAKSYNRNGGNLFYLQQMLGHATLEMPRKYTAIDEEDLAIQHRHSSLLERLR